MGLSETGAFNCNVNFSGENDDKSLGLGVFSHTPMSVDTLFFPITLIFFHCYMDARAERSKLALVPCAVQLPVPIELCSKLLTPYKIQRHEKQIHR